MTQTTEAWSPRSHPDLGRLPTYKGAPSRQRPPRTVQVGWEDCSEATRSPLSSWLTCVSGTFWRAWAKVAVLRKAGDFSRAGCCNWAIGTEDWVGVLPLSSQARRGIPVPAPRPAARLPSPFWAVTFPRP